MANFQSNGADLLAFQLKACGLSGFVRELQFHPTRKWRIDIAFPAQRLAIEVDGGIATGGRHVRIAGVLADCEKTCHLAIEGWRLIRVATIQVKSGEALSWIEQALKTVGASRTDEIS